MECQVGSADCIIEVRLTPVCLAESANGDRSVMSKDLSGKERKKLSKKSFALPGKRKYPIPDKAHARNALARVAQNGTKAEQKKVRAAVKKRFPSIGKKKAKKS
jgi:Family of unknown function (DUF6582)